MMDSLTSMGSSFLFGGILFFVSGIVIYKIFKKRQERASATTTATVVEIIHKRIHYSHSMDFTSMGDGYYPVYEYYANGKLQRVKSIFGTSPCPYQIGEQVELHFNPDKPSEIFVEKDLHILKSFRAVFCVVGGIHAILGAVFIIFHLVM